MIAGIALATLSSLSVRGIVRKVLPNNRLNTHFPIFQAI